MQDTVKFEFHPDNSVTMTSKAESTKCQALAQDFMEMLGSNFNMGEQQVLSSDRVKEEKVVAQVANHS